MVCSLSEAARGDLKGVGLAPVQVMDAVLEPTKQAVLETRKLLDEAHITEQRAALCEAAGQAFYNTSKFTLRDLKSRGNRQQLLADFEDYLKGFSPTSRTSSRSSCSRGRCSSR